MRSTDDNGQAVGAPVVDPDETQFRADTLLMHAELVELELYKIRRELFQDPAVTPVSVGSGNPVEQTLRGYQKDPYNGVIVYNPTPATLSLGFQAGNAYLQQATVPPFSWAAFPERFVNLSIATLLTGDQQATINTPVSVLRLKHPPTPGAGPYGQSAPQQPSKSIPLGAIVQNGSVLDNGFPRVNHTLVVITTASVTGGTVALQGSPDGVNFVNIAQTTPNAGSALFQASAIGAYRWLRAAITAAITGGGAVSAFVASA